MKNIGLFYGSETIKTAKLAEKIQKAFGKDAVTLIAVEDAWENDFKAYKHLIIGTATWFDGELPDYWDEMVPLLRDLDMKGKKIAIFGLGDQKRYSENFADAIGIMANLFTASGATVCGYTSAKGYTFERSKALVDDKFLGLVLDIENQSDKTDERISNWVVELKKEFK